MGGRIGHTHLGVSIGNVLLHSQEGLPGLVFAITHSPELLEVGLDALLGVRASESLAVAFTTTLGLDLVI